MNQQLSKVTTLNQDSTQVISPAAALEMGKWILVIGYSAFQCRSFCRISTRRILPLMVFGSSFTNSTTRGYL